MVRRNISMRIALFVTCLVDLMRPSVGFAALDVLEAAGCEVVVPDNLTCCGQPAHNSGDRKAAQALARKTIADRSGEWFQPGWWQRTTGGCAAIGQRRHATGWCR